MQANKALIRRLLRTARGQIDGILKMIDEDRYCIDISNQVMASQSMLKRANREILRAHMETCIREAFESGDEEEKINEVLNLIDKMER